MKRPHRPRMDTRSLTEELLSKPALNGGWDKLARQQDAQCQDMQLIKKRVRSLSAWRKRWDQRWKWLIGMLGASTAAIAAKLLVEILQHAKLIP